MWLITLLRVIYLKKFLSLKNFDIKISLHRRLFVVKSSFPLPSSFPVGTKFEETYSGDSFAYMPDGTCARVTDLGDLAPCMAVSRNGEEISEERFRASAAFYGAAAARAAS